MTWEALATEPIGVLRGSTWCFPGTLLNILRMVPENVKCPSRAELVKVHTVTGTIVKAIRPEGRLYGAELEEVAGDVARNTSPF